MAKTIRTKTAHKKGFGTGPEPKLGTGYSRAYTHALLALLKKQTGMDTTEMVAMRREMEQREIQPFGKVTRTKLFTPPREEDTEVDVYDRQQKGGLRHRMFTKGFWQVAISTSKGVDAKRPCFTVNVWTGAGWKHHTNEIETGIVSQLGREAYDAWRHAVMADWGNLVAVMTVACEWLMLTGYNYAWSWTSSERSQALLRKLGLRTTEDGVVMLFPHYAEGLFDLRDKTPQLDMGEEMLAAGKTQQEILRAIAMGEYLKR